MTQTITDLLDVALAPVQLSKFIRLNAPTRTAYRPPRAAVGLTLLPDDVLLLVLSLIGVDDILALRMTAKRFFSVTNLRWVWSDALRRHVIDKRLPFPSPNADLKSLSAKELEVRALHAARFQQNWCSPAPRPRGGIEFQARHMETDESAALLEAHPHPISQVLFPSGHNGELVLTVEKARIVCWEVPFGGSEAFMVAERSLPDAAIGGVVVNDEPGSPAMLVVGYTTNITHEPIPGYPLQALPQRITVEAWALDKFHGCFEVLRGDTMIGNPSRLMPLSRLSGEYALIGDPVALWNWKHPEQTFLLSYGNLPSPVPDCVLAVQLVRGHLLIVRQSHIQLLPAPRFDAAGQALPHTTAAAFVHLPDAAKEAVIVVHKPTAQERDDWQFDPVTVLMRVEANGAHQIRKYDILPLPKVRVGGADGPAARCIPCVFPKAAAAAIPVPPSCSGLTVGRNGKGFWMETRNVTWGHSTFPARCIVGFDVTSGVCAAAGVPHWKNDLVLRKKELFVSRVGTGEVEKRKYRIATTSLEDTVGRIAIGGRDGKVQILDLA
ncbi:hypothetical protein FA95DRAFT_1574617 [Auriscalpium vulgare]|uniref:Uncharacterized protein n=1 Tax=Auriscalpium vulgare TaxID=40419 RepID=A0ACB8RJX3_9AGAM|nr:hypothetical protein FA95DRAFT_1574617 [Auriscalpium vulgare]